MALKCTVMGFVLMALISAFTFSQQRNTVYPLFDDLSNINRAGTINYFPDVLTGDVFQDGADRLTAMQGTDGSWGWPLIAPPTYGNILGPIAMGLAKSYNYTKDPDHLAALNKAALYLLTKTNNFSPSDGYLAAELDQLFGVTTYKTHVINNFYNPLAAGTYNRNGAGTLYNTASYVNLIRTSRSGAQANLAAWDIGTGLVAASMCGAATTDWIAGVKAEINELNGAGDYDVIGLAGALYGLAFVGEEFDPSAGQHIAASNLNDLANILASYQITLGGFAWNSAWVIPNDNDESVQETAYAILALDKVNRTAFIANISGAGNYLKAAQLATGGWEQYVGGGENNEITAEALWGLSRTGTIENVTRNIYSFTIQQGINAANPADVILVPDGNFTENLTIAKDIKLISQNGRNFTTITGIPNAGQNGTITVNAPTTGLQIGDAGQGFKIIGIDNGTPGVENAAVYFVGGPHSNTVIRDNEIVAMGDEGLMCEYNTAVTFMTIDGNIFSGQTFVGTNPAGEGFTAQFTLPNVPRQLVVMGGGASGTNTHHITFTNNQITGTAGGMSVIDNNGLPIAPIEQGNNLVTIDADYSVISGNTFAGVTNRYATSFRCRRPGLTLTGNNFVSTGLGAAAGHIYIQNNSLNPALVAANIFDTGSYILNGNQLNKCGGFTTAANAPAGSIVFCTLGELYVANVLKIQDAVAAASNGNKINVAPGTYSSAGSTITVDKSLTIAGVDKTTTFIDVSANGAAWGIRLGADNIVFKNFTIIPAYTAGGSHEGYPLHAGSDSNPMLELFNVTVQDVIVNGSDRTGLDFHGVTGLTLNNITSTNAQYGNGVQLSGCWNVTMNNVTTSGNAWGGIAVYCSNPTYNLNRDKYSNNIAFDFNTNNVAESFYVEDEFGLVNTNINIANFTYRAVNNYNPGTARFTLYTNKTLTDAVNIALLLNSKFANNKSVVIDPAGEFFVGVGMNLQNTIEFAAAGNKVNVLAGTHSSGGSTITVNKSLTLSGADKTTTFLDVSTNGAAWGIRLGADNIVLKNFTIIPAYAAGGSHEGFPVHASSNTTPLLELHNITVQDVTVNGSDRTGLDFHGVTGLTLNNITSTNAQYGNGVQLSGCWNVTMNNITTSGNAWGGIAVYCSNPSYNLNRDKYSNNIAFDFNTSNVAESFYVEDEWGFVNTNINVANSTYRAVNNYNPGIARFTLYTNKSLTDAVNIALLLNTKFVNNKSVLIDPAGEFFVGVGMNLQNTIEFAAAGNKVNVLAGTHSSGGSTITVNKALTLSGADKTTTFLDVSTNGAAWGIRLGADNIVFKNFTIIPAYTTGGSHEGYPLHAGSDSSPMLELFNVTVQDVIVNGSDRTGLDFHGVTGLTLNNITSTNAQYGNGVQLSGCWNVTMNNVTTSGNAWGGIAVYCSNPTYNLNRDKYSNNIAFDFNTNNVAESFYVEDEFGLVNTNINVSNWTYKVNNNYNPGNANYTAYTNKVLTDAINFALLLNTKFGNVKSAVADPLSEFHVAPLMSIQAAIDCAVDGNKINVMAGTFNEAVNVNKVLEISGAGSGTDGTIITNTAGTALSLGQGSIAESLSRVIAKNLRLTGSVTGLVVSSYNTVDNVVSVANTTYGLALNNLTDLIITNSKFNQNTVGLKLASTASADHIVITNCEFIGNQQGWYSDASSTVEPVLDYVTVTGTMFKDNVNKGIYLERLSNAVFDNITVENCGTAGLLNHRAGIDLNLKWRTDYANISIINSTILNSGLGDNNGAGLLIKARSDGGTYGANPAALTNVTVENLEIIGCGNGTYSSGIRIGEANNSLTGTNTSPTNVNIHGCSFIGNSVYALSNVVTGMQINAEMNWWDTIVESEIIAKLNGNIDYDPWIGHVAPPAPDSLTCTAETLFVTLQWKDKSFNESGFKIQRKDGDSLSAAVWVTIDSVGTGVTTYINTGLTQSTTYTYRVFAYNTMGSSMYSNLAQATTLPLPPATFQVTTLIHNGWNIVSIPGMHPVNQNINTWWINRDPLAGVFKYNAGYLPITDAIPGTGYWMKHTGVQVYNTGEEWPAGGILYTPYIPIPVIPGWNLIGGYDYLAMTSGITTTPPGIISGNIFEYSASAGYLNADYLIPGIGYWVNVSSAGSINLPAPGFKGQKAAAIQPSGEWGRIIVTDNLERSSTLYIVNNETDLTAFMLPPVPPAGSYDIRFSSGTLAENVGKGVKLIEMNGLEYPVHIRIENINLRIDEESGKVIAGSLKSGEEIVISDPSVNKITVSKNILPDQFALQQNYPNPFNPSTTISFSIREASNVTLTVYNIVGQKVTEIVNARLEAGNYNYQWSASDLASGLYIYELNASYSTGNFVSTKKMIVLK